MKPARLISIMLCAAPLAVDAAPAAVFSINASWIHSAGIVTPIRLLSASGNAFRYTLPDKPDPLDGTLAAGDSLFVEEPPDFTAAMALLNARKYREAKTKFAAVKDRCKAVAGIDDSHSVQAGYYEMECARKSGDLEGLAMALQGFSKDHLTRPYQLRQIELYILWDAVRTKSWERAEGLAKDRQNSNLGADQRAQVEYCHGLALEGLGKASEALLCYHLAVTTGSGSAEEIARDAALRMMEIVRRDPDLDKALAKHTAASDLPQAVRDKLAEMAALVRLFQNSLSCGMPLPEPYKVFIADEP